MILHFLAASGFNWADQFFQPAPGPSGMRNFIPVRYGTVFLQNPGIPVFFGTVLALYFYTGILGNCSVCFGINLLEQ